MSFAVCLVCMIGCASNTEDEASFDVPKPGTGPERRSESFAVSHPEIRIAKWLDDHAAAISLTYDDYIDSKRSLRVQELVLKHKVHLDYELVTATLPTRRLQHLRTMVKQGFEFFGHGHEHVWHDRLSYDESLRSFRTCYEAMVELGLAPVAYAYPYGAGEKSDTQRALAKSGFLSGRLYERHMSDPYLIPDNELVPPNWFGLPTLVMMNKRAFSFAGEFVNDTNELIPYLEQAIERRAWLTTTYHSIGDESGWGFYDIGDFEKDLIAVARRDFWVASMNRVTLYIREREKARASAKWMAADFSERQDMEILLEDGLANDRFTQPLTLIISVPSSWEDHMVEVYQNGDVVAKEYVTQSVLKVSLMPNEKPYFARLRIPTQSN